MRSLNRKSSVAQKDALNGEESIQRSHKKIFGFYLLCSLRYLWDGTLYAAKFIYSRFVNLNFVE